MAVHLGPDIHLRLADRKTVSREEALAAWRRAYEELELALSARAGIGTLFLVCGPQAAGKTTWINQQLGTAPDSAVFFDAALPSRRHRERALALATASRCDAIAIWLNVPLSLALLRNAARKGAARIPEATIRHVYEQIEVPCIDEGFCKVVNVLKGIET